MRDSPTQIKIARFELARSYGLSDYEAVDVAWVAIVKAANILPEPNEHKRLVALLDRANVDAVRNVLFEGGVNALLSLQPPLETVLTNPHERLNAKRTASELEAVRELRESDPKSALLALVAVMKRIRNRRAHGFKTPYGPRDQEILRAAAPVLRALGEVAINAVGT